MLTNSLCVVVSSCVSVKLHKDVIWSVFNELFKHVQPLVMYVETCAWKQLLLVFKKGLKSPLKHHGLGFIEMCLHVNCTLSVHYTWLFFVWEYFCLDVLLLYKLWINHRSHLCDARLQMCHFPHCVFVCVFVWLVCPPSTDKVPHFSRLGDVEVNAGQNASFQCVATGKVSESEPFLLEVRSCFFIIFAQTLKPTALTGRERWLEEEGQTWGIKTKTS